MHAQTGWAPGHCARPETVHCVGWREQKGLLWLPVMPPSLAESSPAAVDDLQILADEAATTGVSDPEALIVD